MTTAQRVIRSYTLDDRKKVIGLLRLNTPKFFNKAEEEDLLLYLEHHLEDYFVVEFNGHIIGAGGINYFPENREARISWDLIHPDYQSKGVGKELLQHRFQKIKSQPYFTRVVVRTSQLVNGFYEKMGFSTENVQKDYWAPGLDLYVMKMDL